MVRDPQFLYHGWKEHELEIRFHTTLTPRKWKKVMIFASKLKKCNFYWWRHNILCSIHVISLISYWSSAKFWYIVAEIIIFRICIHYFSFLWRHHSENLDFRRHVKILRVYVLSLWELNFFQIMNWHDNVPGVVAPLFFLHFLWDFDML